MCISEKDKDSEKNAEEKKRQAAETVGGTADSVQAGDDRSDSPTG